MLKQQASKRWQRCSRRVSALQMRFANQRADVLHKISRALAEGCELVAIGNWEPEKEVSYRKKLRALKKKVKQGIAGAAQELEQLKNEKSKQGPKGAKKKRRSARDRSIATLRRLVNEKAERASIKAFTEINEAGSTQTCCICGETTGPKQDLSIRQWRCRQCNTNHNRDLNSAFNILKKAEIELGAAQAPNQEKTLLDSSAARMTTQGVMEKTAGNDRLQATASGTQARGVSTLNKHEYSSLPKIWNDGPKALKSLCEMGLIRPLNNESTEKNDFEKA